MHTLSLPISLQQTKKKKFYINLNNYRNAHHYTLNKAKIDFAELIVPQLATIPKMGKIKLHYTLFPGSWRLSDLANICSVVDKFFSDCLTKSGVITDDNYTILSEVKFNIGTIDKTNPRVDVTIIDDDSDSIDQDHDQTEHKKKDTTMKITILEKEIHAAIIAYMHSIMVLKEGTRIDIDLRATRGEDGYTAEIDITPGNGGGGPVAMAKPTKTLRDIRKEPVEEAEPAEAEEAEEEDVQEEETPEPPAKPISEPKKKVGVFKVSPKSKVAEDAEEEEDAPDAPEEDQEEDEEGVDEAPAKPTAPKKSLFNKMKNPDNA